MLGSSSVFCLPMFCNYYLASCLMNKSPFSFFSFLFHVYLLVCIDVMCVDALVYEDIDVSVCIYVCATCMHVETTGQPQLLFLRYPLCLLF